MIPASEQYVFISYSWQDGGDHATRLSEALTRRGIAVTLDRTHMNPFNDFTGEIDKAIKNASHLVVCVTPDIDREDSYVRNEIGYALGHRKPIIPAMFGDVVPPSSIVNITRVYFNRDWSGAFDQLLDTLSKPRDYQAPAVDPFQDYLDALRQEIEDYLEIAIIREIPLRSRETPDMVQTTATKRMLGSLFATTLHVKPEEQKPPLAFESLGDAFKHFGGRMLLLGEPGAGKTITLMTFVRAMVASRLADRNNPLPIFARIADWDGKTALAEWLAGQVPISRDDLAALINGGKVLLALDGLDELGGEREDPVTRESYDPRQRFLDLVPPNTPLIASCRITDYAAIGQKAALKGAVTLQPIDDAQIQGYLSEQPDLWAALQADDDLREIARTPLLLSLFTFAFNGLDAEAKKLRDLKRGDLRDAIFETYVRRRYEHERLKPYANLPYSLEALTNALKQAALEDAGNIFAPEANKLYIEALGEDAEGLLAQGRLLHLLVPIDEAYYRFIHLLLRDHFAFPAAMAALSDPDMDVRLDAIEALGLLGDQRAVEGVLPALNDPEAEVRSHAGDTLGVLGDKRAVKGLLAALNDPEEDVRVSAAYALGQLGDRRAVEGLLAALSDVEARVRRDSAEALGKLGDRRVVDNLLAALHDPNEEVRIGVVQGLGALGGGRAVEALLTILREADNPKRVRSAAGYELGRLGYRPGVDGLVEALRREQDSGVRLTLVGALGSLSGIKAEKGLLEALRDEDLLVSRRAVTLLEHLGTPKALAAVEAWRREHPDDY